MVTMQLKPYLPIDIFLDWFRYDDYTQYKSLSDLSNAYHKGVFNMPKYVVKTKWHKLSEQLETIDDAIRFVEKFKKNHPYLRICEKKNGKSTDLYVWINGIRQEEVIA